MITKPPRFTEFKPAGIRNAALSKINLTLDEYEALRLADFDGLNHNEAAVKMEVSRSTFSRLVKQARNKVANFLIRGMNLHIESGAYRYVKEFFKCRTCNSIFEKERFLDKNCCPECSSNEVINISGRKHRGRGRKRGRSKNSRNRIR